MSLTEKVAIVTGGGGAIGRAICRHLAGDGARVAVFDVTSQAAERTVDMLRETGNGGAAFAVDVRCYEAVAAAVDQVLRRFSRIDILVNCAGGSARDKMALFHEQSLDVIHDMLSVNLVGALHCIRAVSPLMVAAKQGAIINVTSIVARGGKKRCVEYGAAKGGLIAATRSLALELGAHNVTVNCVSPGLVQRDPIEDAAAFAHRFSAVNRVCTQDDVARAVLFLAQPESDFITGQELAVDGGRSLGLKGDS
ncbi:MAG: SDR family oxidoreductase [Candidatus Brocadiaceae bacterium]|nr:SDR family oxidoreductase [Candidatus Brocadiaceae bacterium]